MGRLTARRHLRYAPAMQRGRITSLSVDSDLLRDNPLGDPHRRDLPVYLPPGYDEDPGRRYPVVFVLAAYTSTGPMLLNHRGFGESSPDRLDRLIGSGEVPPLVAVFPDCWTRWGGSQYLDSAATGPYASHLVEELVPAVDAAFRTDPRRSARAVTGMSSGGFGALRLGMAAPETFGLVAATAADCAFDLSIRPELPRFVATVEAAGGLEAFLDGFSSARRLRGDQIGAMMVVALSACYSPAPERPPILADLPVDLHTAELVPDVWERWLGHDPVRLVAQHAEALASLRLLSLDAGRRDEYHLQFGHRILARELERAGVPFVTEEFDDGHRGIGYRQEHALVRIGEVLSAAA